MPETCKNYILNCSHCRSLARPLPCCALLLSLTSVIYLCLNDSLLPSPSTSASACLPQPLTAHKFNKQGARARTQDTLASAAPAHISLLQLLSWTAPCGCSEACSLEGSPDRQRQCCCSSPKPKQNQLPSSLLPAPECRQYKFGKQQTRSHARTHTHTTITLRTVRLGQQSKHEQ